MNPAPGYSEPVHTSPSEGSPTTPSEQEDDPIHLQLASSAVQYVRYKVKNGSENRSEDFAFRAMNGEKTLCLANQRAFQAELAELACQCPKPGVLPRILDIEDRICFDAESVEKFGLGNCGEQASVAFKWLREFPIGGLVYVNLMGGNHSFVVLCAGPAVREDDVFRTDKAKMRFGPNAIVCDPWLGGGSFFKVADEWDVRLKQMIREANPKADPDAVLVQCICRATNKDRRTKEAEWVVRNARRTVRGLAFQKMERNVML